MIGNISSIDFIKELFGFPEPNAGEEVSDDFREKLSDSFDNRGNIIVNNSGDLITYSVGSHKMVRYVEDNLAVRIKTAELILKDSLPTLQILLGDPSSTASSPPNHQQIGDINFLQRNRFFEGALFQVASNFNALEQPNKDALPGPIKAYVNDRTQGPAAVLMTIGGLIYRRYIAYGEGQDPADEETYISYPFIFVSGEVPDVYKGVTVTPGGWLDVEDCETEQGSLAAKEYAISGARGAGLLYAQGVGMIGVYNCSSMLHIDYTTGNVYLSLKNEMKISQALCSTFDTITSTKNQDTQINEMWIYATVFAAYYNTLRFALEIRAQKVVLTLMGGGAFGIKGDVIYDCMLLAIKQIVAGGRDFSKLTVYVSIFNKNDPNSRLFLNEAQTTHMFIDKSNPTLTTPSPEKDVNINIIEGSDSLTP